MKRTFDLLASLTALGLLCVPLLLLALLVAITSKGPVLYWSDRVGQHNRIFRMPKLRTMKTCLLYTSPSPRDGLLSRMPSSA